MEIGLLLQLLQGSLGSNQADIKSCEVQMSQAENLSAGPLLIQLLKIVFASDQALTVRQAAAIYSKNLLKRRWVKAQEEEPSYQPLDTALKDQVRSVLIESICGSGAAPLPRQIQAQVNAIISFIADVDFPAGWPDLLPSLAKTLSGSPSAELRLNALTVVCSVLKKYKTAARSPQVLKELQYILSAFQDIHMHLFVSVLPQILSDPSGATREVFLAMENILEVFTSLNVVDIPEFYQDNLKVWMEGFFKLLSVVSSGKNAESEPGPWEAIKAFVCENLALYADKYQEVFEPFVTEAVRTVWSLLVSLDLNETKFDHLVASGIKFLSSTAHTRWSSSPFEEKEALCQIVEKLIIPNIQLRDADLELFSDNPDDYIRKDLQNADAETRRRSAVDLVKALSKFYEDKITPILLQYIGNLLSQYAGNHRAKDACVQLVSALAAKGETRASGVSLLNEKVDINQFFIAQISPELAQSTSGNEEEKSVVKSSCLKFFILFRSKLRSDLVAGALDSVLLQIDQKSAKVVSCYAAQCALLILGLPGLHAVARDPQAVIDKCISIIANTREQNDYLIRLVFKLLKQQKEPSTSPVILSKLMSLVQAFSANPVNAVFTHFLFESVGQALAINLSSSKQSLRDLLVQPLCRILEMNIVEYMPYSLQILSLLIEAASESQVEVFSHLFVLLLNDQLWKNLSLIPGLVRIVSAYCFRSDVYGSLIMKNCMQIAEKFQSLVNSNKFEHLAFDLSFALLGANTQVSVSTQALHQIILAVLTKIHTKRSEKLLKQFGLLLACALANPLLQPEQLIAVIESIQPGIANQVIKDLWMHSLSTLNAKNLPAKELKVLFVSLAKLVSNPSIQTNPTIAQSVFCAIEAMVCSNPLKTSAESFASIGITSAHDAHSDDALEFEVAYSKLSSTVNQVSENDFIPQLDSDGMSLLKHALRVVAQNGLLHANPALANWAVIA